MRITILSLAGLVGVEQQIWVSPIMAYMSRAALQPSRLEMWHDCLNIYTNTQSFAG